MDRGLIRLRSGSHSLKAPNEWNRAAPYHSNLRLLEDYLSKSNHIEEVQAPPSLQQVTSSKAKKYVLSLLLLPCPSADLIEAPQRLQPFQKPCMSSQKRKRGQEEQEDGHPSSRTQEQPSSKRLQTSPSSCISKNESRQAPVNEISEGSIDPLQYWIQTGKWRKEYFEQDSQVREDFERGKSLEEPEQSDWLQEDYAREPCRVMNPFAHLHNFLARKKSSSSQSISETASDQLPWENKSSQYNNTEYEIRLEQKGSYMRKSTLGITDTSRDLCRVLLKKEQTIPQDTLLRDDLFHETCKSVRGRNEAMTVRNISLLICPSAQVLRLTVLNISIISLKVSTRAGILY